jgi:hypothetical protein
MAQIQPITLWIQGQTKTANAFDLSIVNDDLSTRAVLYYRLGSETQSETETETIWLQDGNLTIDGEDYQTWDADPSANEWIYNWAAQQLNITII